MFNGTLGAYPHTNVHIDIDPNAKPVHSRIPCTLDPFEDFQKGTQPSC
jgi:hypothetical protein